MPLSQIASFLSSWALVPAMVAASAVPSDNLSGQPCISRGTCQGEVFSGDDVGLMQQRGQAAAATLQVPYIAAIPPPANRPISAASLRGPPTIAGVPVCYMRREGDRGCSLESISPGSTSYIAPGGRTSCIDSSQPYVFRVTRGSSNNVVFYMQDGGACFDRATTVIRPQCNTGIKPMVDEGIFKRDEPQNPYADWTTVVVMYCSGDAHVGFHSSVYMDLNNELVEVKQHGFWNVLSALDWVQREIPAIDKMVLAGSSAGSLGVQIWSKYFFDRLQGQISGRKAVIADSFLQLDMPNAPPGRFLVQFGACWLPIFEALPADLQTRCRLGQVSATEAYIASMKANPDIVHTFITTQKDVVQIGYYNLLASSVPFQPYTNPIRFTSMLFKELEELDALPNFVSYTLQGADHTFLHQTRLYNAKVPPSAACIAMTSVICPMPLGFPEARCLGNQCCPSVPGLANGGTFPCPSADSHATAACQESVKVSDCLTPTPSLAEWISSLPLESGATLASQCEGEFLLAANWSDPGLARVADQFCPASQAGKAITA